MMPDSVMTIFHLSDIHVGEPGVNLSDLRRILDGIEKAARDAANPLMLVTGDLTADGLREEYEGFNSVVQGFSIPKIIIPGNHDERNYGTAHFERLFGSRSTTHDTEDVAICAVDSAEPDNDDGHVGRGHYPEIRNYFLAAGDKVRVFVLHHHLVPVPHTGREHNVVEDAGDVLGTLEDARCSLVLNGHRHVPWMWVLNGMVIYNGGTLLSRRIRGASTQVHTRIDLTMEDVTFTLKEKGGTERVYSRCPIRV